jgi:hypothetical protein
MADRHAAAWAGCGAAGFGCRTGSPEPVLIVFERVMFVRLVITLILMFSNSDTTGVIWYSLRKFCELPFKNAFQPIAQILSIRRFHRGPKGS